MPESLPPGVPADWREGLPRFVASGATPEVTGRIVAYRRGLITSDQLADAFARRYFTDPARLEGKEPDESTEQMYQRVEDQGVSRTRGSWDEVDTAHNFGLFRRLDEPEDPNDRYASKAYLAMCRRMHEIMDSGVAMTENLPTGS